MEGQQPLWFQGHGTEEVKSRVLPPPEYVLETHQRFKKQVRKALGIDNSNVHLASTKEELNKQIEEVQDGLPPRLVAQQNLDQASNSHNVYTENRNHGAKRVGRWAQEFAFGFSAFVSAYSGIVDAVKTAGGPYGEVAYQTLSILLIVVVNKSKNDTKIKDMLDEVRKSFPRLEIWTGIYPTKNMRTLVAKAYEQVMEFSRTATKYFTSFLRRLTMAIIAPSSMGIDKAAAVIHKTLAEINSEAMYGLHGRSQNIETQVVSSGKNIDQLKAEAISLKAEAMNSSERLKRMEATNDLLRRYLQEQKEQFEAYKRSVELRVQQEDQQRLKILEEDLGVTFPSAETDVDKTKRNLMQVFPNSPHYVPHMPTTGYHQMSRSLLEKTEFYRSWISSTESSMLFLSGRTAIEGRRYKGLTHCWLSPAAIYITEDLTHKGIHVAFFSCHPDLDSKSVPTKQIISSIILQILKKKPQILREKGVQFHSAALNNAFKNSDNAKTQARAMVKLLNDVLAAVKDVGKTFIVLDRLDQCEGKFDFLMDELVRLIGNPACNVKIAIIAETSMGGGEWHPEYLPGGEYKLDRVFRHQNWNQSTLTNQEINKERHLTWSSEGLML